MPSTPTSHRSVRPRLASRSVVRTVNTICRRSGETCGSEMRSMASMSCTENGWVSGSAAIAGRVNSKSAGIKRLFMLLRSGVDELVQKRWASSAGRGLLVGGDARRATMCLPARSALRARGTMMCRTPSTRSRRARPRGESPAASIRYGVVTRVLGVVRFRWIRRLCARVA